MNLEIHHSATQDQIASHDSLQFKNCVLARVEFKQGPDLIDLRRTNWRGKLLLGFGMLILGTHGILNSISTSLEHPTVSTSLEQPKFQLC